VVLLLLDRQPDDLYNRRAAAWVYLDSIKKDSLNLEEALPYVEALLALGLESSEGILWEQLYWQVAKLLFRLSEVPKASLLARLWVGWNTWPQAAGQGYSILLKALLKHAASWPNLPEWVEVWGWGNLREADFEPEVLPDGKALSPLTERVYLAVAKVYLSQNQHNPALSSFLEKLDAVSDAHPNLLYLIYYRASLWHKLEQTSRALEIFLPFARKKQRDFWVWDLLGQLHSHDAPLYMACLAKALSCRTKPEFLVKIRQKMAGLLMEAGQWTEARAEIEALCAVRVAHQWRIPTEVTRWMASAEYQQADKSKSNVSYYTSAIPRAETLLKSEVPMTLAVVWSVNTQKQTAQFVVNEHTHGGFGYARFGLTLSPGDCVMLGLEKVSPGAGDAYWKVGEAGLSADPAPTNLLREVEGPLKSLGKIGFVEDVFVDQELLPGLEHLDICEVKAVKAFNTKKNCWGWKAIRVKKQLGD